MTIQQEEQAIEKLKREYDLQKASVGRKRSLSSALRSIFASQRKQVKEEMIEELLKLLDDAD